MLAVELILSLQMCYHISRPEVTKRQETAHLTSENSDEEDEGEDEEESDEEDEIIVLP